jgi:hypothetical protein
MSWRGRGLLLLCALGVSAAALSASRPASPAPGSDLSPYGGLGTWVDIYDQPVWKNPAPALRAMKARGARTLYLETSNYRQTTDVVRPTGTGRILEAAHSLGLKVVAWYLPGFLRPAVDLRRSLAALRFRSGAGQRFDSFALDIEASIVRSVPLRSARLLSLSTALRRTAGLSYPLGAIIPAPRGMQLLPKYWPQFPYRRLAQLYDVFLPMAYFTYQTREATYGYTLRNVGIIRREVGDSAVPIHVIGGVADSASAAQVRGFVRAARACGVLGASLYDFLTTKRGHWAELAPVKKPARRSAC